MSRDMCLGGAKRPPPPAEPDTRDSSLDARPAGRDLAQSTQNAQNAHEGSIPHA